MVSKDHLKINHMTDSGVLMMPYFSQHFYLAKSLYGPRTSNHRGKSPKYKNGVHADLF